MGFELINKRHNRSSLLPIFILCDNCHWRATYLDKTRIPIDNICPQCNTDNTELSSFPMYNNHLQLIIMKNMSRGIPKVADL